MDGGVGGSDVAGVGVQGRQDGQAGEEQHGKEDDERVSQALLPPPLASARCSETKPNTIGAAVCRPPVSFAAAGIPDRYRRVEPFAYLPAS